MARGLGFSGLIRRTFPYSCLLRPPHSVASWDTQLIGCGRPILTRILTGTLVRYTSFGFVTYNTEVLGLMICLNICWKPKCLYYRGTTVLQTMFCRYETAAACWHNQWTVGVTGQQGMLTPSWHLIPPLIYSVRGPCTPILWFLFLIRLMRLITDSYFCHFTYRRLPVRIPVKSNMVVWVVSAPLPIERHLNMKITGMTLWSPC
jgi:hypothetical protein